MKLIINKDRTTVAVGTWGTVNENDFEILDFEFPAELDGYNKRIVYYLDDERVWDTIVNNKAYITNAITTKGDVKAYVWCTKENTEREADTDFRTMLFEMHFYENENADGIVPTEEQVDGFNTMLTAMNAKIDEVDALETTIGAAEAERQEAEATRVSNENTRESNESTRQTNEQTRQTQEADRERRTDEAIADIEDKTAEYNANAEAKTTAFNNNATQKTNEFNSNYTQKVNDFNTNASTQKTDFNSNASSKTSAFNSNAETKTNAFNTNATNKTNDFNNNATEKTTAFDDNASTKTSEFNTNAESKTSAFNDNATQKTTNFDNNAQEKIDEYDEHIVDYQAQIDELQEEVDELSENMPWNETEQATEISVTDAAKYSRNKLELFGNTEQTQYSGKNLLKPGTTKTENGITFSVQEDGTIIANGTATANASINLGTKDGPLVDLPAGTYTISGCPEGGSSLTYRIGTNIFGSDKFDIGTGYSGTINNNVTNKKVWISIYKDTTVNNLTFKPMIELGDTKTDYEPYTGGVPSPNPDYPQDIHVVTGNNTIGVTGKNIFSGDTLIQIGGTGTKRNGFYVTTPGTYTVSYSNNNSFRYFSFRVIDNGVYGTYTSINSPYTFTISQNQTAIVYIGDENKTFSQQGFYNVQIEQGSTATDYVQYCHADYPINLGSLELCKIGNSQDYLYKENGNWYKYGIVYKTIVDGNKSFTQNKVSSNINTTRYYTRLTKRSINNLGLSDNFINRNADMPHGDYEYIALLNNDLLFINILISRLGTDTEENLKSWLSTHNVTFYGVLATPTTTQITDTILIAQLDEIYEHLKLVKGTNNITVTASDLAPYMQLSYMQDIKSKLDNLDSRLALLE